MYGMEPLQETNTTTDVKFDFDMDVVNDATTEIAAVLVKFKSSLQTPRMSTASNLVS